MSTETDFLCFAVKLHAERVRELLGEIQDAKVGSVEWIEACSGLRARAEYLANRADELAALCKEHKA